MDENKVQGSGMERQGDKNFPSELVIRAIINHSSDTIYFKDLESKFVFIGKSQADKFGLDDPSEAIGKTDLDFFPEEHAREAYLDEQRIIKTGTPMWGKIEKNIWPAGGFSWVSTTKYPFFDMQGNIIGTWGITRDITLQKIAEDELKRLNEQLKEANERLALLSIKDSLSDLYNHRYCFDVIKKEYDIYERRSEKGIGLPSSLIILDIDFFKKINDEYGHLVGDLIIRQVSDILRDNIRNTDYAFRFGGDEFVMFLRDTPLEEAKNVAEKIRDIIMKTEFINNNQSINVTSSMGVASFNEAKNPNELLEIADKRLYMSKENGRNTVT